VDPAVLGHVAELVAVVAFEPADVDCGVQAGRRSFFSEVAVLIVNEAFPAALRLGGFCAYSHVPRGSVWPSCLRRVVGHQGAVCGEAVCGE